MDGRGQEYVNLAERQVTQRSGDDALCRNRDADEMITFPVFAWAGFEKARDALRASRICLCPERPADSTMVRLKADAMSAAKGGPHDGRLRFR